MISQFQRGVNVKAQAIKKNKSNKSCISFNSLQILGERLVVKAEMIQRYQEGSLQVSHKSLASKSLFQLILLDSDLA